MRLRMILPALVVIAAGGAAHAQPSADARAAAAALFEDGKRLMADGKLDVACPKLAESQRLDPGMGTLYNLGLCYEAQQRTASAWVSFRDVAAMAAAAGRSDREKAARGKVAALEPKLMRLTITVQAGAQAAGVEVRRDGVVIASALWGTSVPLDPGRHVVSASAPGREPWEIAIVLDRPGATVTVDVPPPREKGTAVAPAPVVSQPPAPAPPAAPPPPAPVLVAPPAPPPAVQAPSPRPWQRPLGITATAVGAVSLGLGIGLGFMAKSAFEGSNTSGNCSEKTDVCNKAGLAQRDDALMKGNIGTGVFIAGAVLAAGGVVLWATAPSSRRASVGLGPGSVTVRGAF